MINWIPNRYEGWPSQSLSLRCEATMPVLPQNERIGPRGANAVQLRARPILHLLGTNNLQAVCTKIDRLLTRIDCPLCLEYVGVLIADEVKGMMNSISAEIMSNNPVRGIRKQLSHALLKVNPSTPETKKI